MRKEAMRKKTLKPEPLGNILHKVLKKLDVHHKRKDRRIVDLWNRAVGEQIASRTLPETLRRGSLHVLVSSPAWLHQLQFLKEEILVRLNELSGADEFRRLFFSIGEIPEISTPDAEKKTPPFSAGELKERDRRMMEESLAAIKDTDLRETIQRVMLAEIIRRREIQKRRRV
jgi:hypothetical protein